MKRLKYKALKFSSIALTCFGVFFVSHKCTDGFTIYSITQTLEQGQSALPKELSHLYDTEFDYLGHGAQAFAFVSKDRQYVIKYIRFDHLRPKPFVRLFHNSSHPYITFRLNRSEKEIRELCSSFNLAQTQLKNETGVLHFQKQSLDKPLVIFDKIGCKHKVKDAPFIVQKFTKSLGEQITNLSADDCKAIIDQLLALSNKRYQLGIKDKDPNLLTNFGYDQKTLVEFDIGRFYPTTILESLKVRRDELKEILKPLMVQYCKNDPSLEEYLEQKLNNL